MNEEILKTIKYFAIFEYAPTLEEIYTFLTVKTSKKALQKQLSKMRLSRYSSGDKYTLPEYSKISKNYIRKKDISEKKIKKINKFVKTLSWFPQIKLIGLSGSVAMMNAGEKDDVDLFIIASYGRLWTGRLICLGLAQLFNLRRVPGQKKAKDKVCLNLFFGEKNLLVPKFKETEYIAHEILQMKPLVSKGDVYEEFLYANKWVMTIFPNSKIKNLKLNKNLKLKIKNYLSDVVESIAKRVQLYFINRHKTSEIITDSQLWFFPDDFEKKIKKQHGVFK